MNRWASLLQTKVKPIILGMIHVKALPGSPTHSMKMADIISAALEDAEIYRKYKIDGVIVENMHDTPYVMSSQLGPATTSSMTAVCSELRRFSPDLPIGVQVLAGGNKEALAVALAADCDFIRAESFVYAHIADEGLMNGCAGELLRYRSAILAGHISVLCDIKKKHSSHAITSDLTIEQVARDSEFFLSDGVIVTGESTGMSASAEQLESVKEAVAIPVLVGSGVTADNISSYASADALIVGSYFKKDGKWLNPIDEQRVSDFVSAYEKL